MYTKIAVEHIRVNGWIFLLIVVGVNFQREFIFTSICNKNWERESNKDNTKTQVFMWKFNLGKTKWRGERIHYFQEVTMNSAELKLWSILWIQWNNGLMRSLLSNEREILVSLFFLCPPFFFVLLSQWIYARWGFIDSASYVNFNNCTICTLWFFYYGLGCAFDSGSDFYYLL